MSLVLYSIEVRAGHTKKESGKSREAKACQVKPWDIGTAQWELGKQRKVLGWKDGN